jgi:flagellar protein FlaJ
MELRGIHVSGVLAGFIVIALSLFFIGSEFFFLLIGLGFIITASPFIFTLMTESKVASEKEEMFIEFARNLVESVKAGTPISKSIVNVRDKPYGVLTNNIRKLANQIYLGVPLGIALDIFAKDVKNKTVSRTLTLIGQAEKSGGDIGSILESVAEAVSTADRLKKERKAIISTLVIQGYIIFFVFMIIILVMQFKIIPLITTIDVGGEIGSLGVPGIGGGAQQIEVSNAFFYLLLIQGIFSGLTIGKLAEGSLKSGVKHSFALTIMSFSISATANFFIS